MLILAPGAMPCVLFTLCTATATVVTPSILVSVSCTIALSAEAIVVLALSTAMVALIAPVISIRVV